MKEFTVSQEDAGMRLDRYLRRILGTIGQGTLEKALRSGKIRVETNKVKSSYRLNAGETISIAPIYLTTNDSGLEKPKSPVMDQAKAKDGIDDITLEETASWRALNKPSGLAVQGGTGTYKHIDGMLNAGFPEQEYKLVHRIDKDTSGLLMVAKGHLAARQLTQGFKNHDIKKFYLALVVGKPPASGVIEAALHKAGGKGLEKMVIDEENGQPAITDFICLDSAEIVSLVGFSPRTGRTHQLRAHAAHIGTPILGDGKYGGSNAHIGGFAKLLHLHAWGIKLADGHEIFAPLSPHFSQSCALAGLTIPVSATFPYFGFTGQNLLV